MLPSRRNKRWIFSDTSDGGPPPVNRANNPAAGGSLSFGSNPFKPPAPASSYDYYNHDYDNDYYYDNITFPTAGSLPSSSTKPLEPPTTASSDDDYTDYSNDNVTVCILPKEQVGLDAYLWIKAPGRSDGRLFPTGEYHPCLMGHDIECSFRCPQYIPALGGHFMRFDRCECIDTTRPSIFLSDLIRVKSTATPITNGTSKPMSLNTVNQTCCSGASDTSPNMSFAYVIILVPVSLLLANFLIAQMQRGG